MPFNVAAEGECAMQSSVLELAKHHLACLGWTFVITLGRRADRSSFSMVARWLSLAKASCGAEFSLPPTRPTPALSSSRPTFRPGGSYDDAIERLKPTAGQTPHQDVLFGAETVR